MTNPNNTGECCERCELRPEDLKAGKMPSCLIWECPCHHSSAPKDTQSTSTIRDFLIVENDKKPGGAGGRRIHSVSGCMCADCALPPTGAQEWEKEFESIFNNNNRLQFVGKESGYLWPPEEADARSMLINFIRKHITAAAAKKGEANRISYMQGVAEHHKRVVEIVPGKNSVPITTVPGNPWNDGYHVGWNDFFTAMLTALTTIDPENLSSNEKK